MVQLNNEIDIQSLRHSHFNNNLSFISSGHKPPNTHKWGPGVRDIFALHYIISGKGFLETRQGIFPLQAGESFLIYPHMEIYYYPDGQDPWEYVWVEFSGDEAGHLLAQTELEPSNPVLPGVDVNFMPYFNFGVNATNRRFEKIRCDAKLRLLISYYLEYYQKENIFQQADYVEEAKGYIHNNYWRDTIKVSDIVDVTKVERSYLFRLFKRETGMSISAYLTQYRINRACELLKSADLSIKSVAYSVGYRDQLYFSKVFKKITSHTPTEYMTLYTNQV